MSTPNIPVVQTVGLTKVFTDFWRRPKAEAVKDLNLDIRPGEVFGLLGPNGSGKSTTIKMILGLLYPTRGRISVFGRPPTDVATKRRVGYLPEESYLYPFLDARETLNFYGRLFRQHGQIRNKRVEMLLDMVGLQREARRRISEYSKGMARRIGLAQALINDPEFLILDEPTSGLDPIGTRQIKDVIRQLGDMGKTILLSSHLLADVEDVCDRVAILYGGQQQAAGDISDLLAKEDQTQILTPRLDPATVEEVRATIKRLESKDILEVRAPRDRLENLFLRIVEEAQRAKVATSGVGQAGAMPEFLGASAGEGDQLISSLLRAEEPEDQPQAPQPQPEAPAEPAPASDVLENLLGKPEEPARTEDKKRDSEAPRSADADADYNVIEDLMRKEDRNDG